MVSGKVAQPNITQAKVSRMRTFAKPLRRGCTPSYIPTTAYLFIVPTVPSDPMAKPNSAGKITIPASTRRLRSATLQEDLVSAPGAPGDEVDVAVAVGTPGKGENNVSSAEENNSPSLPSEAVPAAPDRRYNTRPTNDPHPARTAHLARRSHAEVKEDLEAEIRRKKEALDAQREEYQRRIDELAELEENMNLQAAEDSIENVLERESQMILEDEATLNAAAVAMGLGNGGKHFILYREQISPR